MNSGKTGYEGGPQHYYDEVTGTDLLIVPADEYDVRNKERLTQQREYLKRQEYVGSDSRHYVNCYHDSVVELNRKLGVNELGVIMKLLPYMRINTDGRLMAGSKRMGVTEISKVIGKSQRWTISLVKSLVDNEVLSTEKSGRRNVYNVSERYHTIGYVLKGATRYTKLYQTKTKTDIKNISIQAAGVLYKMLPFFHYDKYYLCGNPNEKNPETIEHLTQTKFSELANVDVKLVNRSITELCKKGFVMISKSFGATVMMVNPDVMYRKKFEDEYTDTIRYQFKQTKDNSVQNPGNNDWLPY